MISESAEPRSPLVMIVDDNETDCFLHKKVIELSNFSRQVVLKENGRTAMDYLDDHKSAPSRLPDFIFLDLNMPKADGFQFLREFEGLPEEVRSKCKIVILSSSDNKRDTDRIKGNKYVLRYIPKPLSEEELQKVRDLGTGEGALR